MYRRILIAADPDRLSGDAAPAVAAVAQPDAEVLIVLVRDLSRSGARRDAGEDALEHLFDEVRARHLRARLDRRDAPEARVAEEIAAAARAFAADLIVLGSHRHGDLFTIFRGSVGHALAARVGTPIMIVGSPLRPPGEVRRILVGVDGGHPSREAVAAAVELSSPETEVTVVYVDTPVGGLGMYPPYDGATPSGRPGSQVIDEELAVLSAAGVRARGRRLYAVDGVGTALAKISEQLDTDLIVLGSRRLGTLQALLLGSVAHDVIARTRRTVVLAATGARVVRRRVSARNATPATSGVEGLETAPG